MSEKFITKFQEIPFENHQENFADLIIAGARNIPQKNFQLIFFTPKIGYFLALASLALFLLGLNVPADSDQSLITNLEEIYYSNNEIL